MKLWRACIIDPHEGCCYAWCVSKKDALAECKAFIDSGLSGPTGVLLVDIPTTKAGLMKWLNDNFTRDND